MKKISELAARQLKWTQPSALKMHYELRAGDDPVGTLRFRSSFGSFATGESGDGCWTFKRVGFWQTRATVRVCGADADIAVFKNNTWSGGGTLELPDGRQLPATTNFWQTQIELQNTAGEVLVRFKRGGVIHLSAAVEIQHVASSMPELPWMVMLGCYLIVMMEGDGAAAAA